MNKKQKIVLVRILVTAALMIGIAFVPAEGLALCALYLVPYIIISYDILAKAGRGILNKQVFDENFLMAVATVGAMVLAVTSTEDYTEAVAVMLFYQIGEWFQRYAVGRSRHSISELMDIRPDYANLAEPDGQIRRVDPEEVAIGSTIEVHPGEKVPIDGVVESGSSSLNTVALTGESLPRDVTPGDEVTSGCINMTGVLRIRTTKEFGESTVSKILELVEDAGARKSKSEDFIAKFARIYTPAVCYSALALALLPPLVGILTGGAPEWNVWLYRALTFLVISCPCALVISIPLSFFAGIGGASREGILVKGSNYLEALANTRMVVFDKTGTLTKGVFEVNAIHHCPLPDEKLIELAVLAESASSHPISKSLRRAYGKDIDYSRVHSIKEISGNGVIAVVDGHEIACGNHKLMEQFGVPYKHCHLTGTIIHIALDGEYVGHIVINDVVKPESAEAIRALGRAGVRRIVMLTGDLRAAAEQAAAELGISEVYSELLPDAKVAKVEELLAARPAGGKLAFTGDGINDAPVLSRADIGIAMGALGSDAAIEAADVVLMDDDPMKIAKAIRISRKCMGIVYQNITFAIGIKIVCLVLGALGFANMWLAIFADVGVMILAVLNAIRAMFVKNI